MSLDKADAATDLWALAAAAVFVAACAVGAYYTGKSIKDWFGDL